MRIAGALAFATLAAFIGVNEALGWQGLRQSLQQALERSAGVPVRLEGKYRLHFLPGPRLTAQHVVVGAAHGLPLPQLLMADGLRVEARWSDLWRWRRGERLVLRTLAATSLDANLVRASDGHASWQLGERRDTAAAAASATQTMPRIETWWVQRGRIRWQDEPLRVDVVLALDAREDGAGHLGTLTGSWRQVPLRLRFDAGGLLPLIDSAAVSPVALRVEGTVGATRLGFDGSAAALLDARRLAGRVELVGPSLARVGKPLGLTLPQTPPFHLDGQLAHSGDVWTLQQAQVRLGATSFGGDFRFDRRSSPPHLQGQAAGPRLALADLGAAVGVQGEQAGERVLPQRRFDLPALRAMQADVKLEFEQLVLGVERLGPLRRVHAQLRLRDGVLRVEDLEAWVAQGRLRGRSQLDSNRPEGHWQAQLTMSEVDIARWIRPRPAQARAPGAAASDAAPVRPLTGVLNASVDVRGHGLSTATILGTLDGQARARLSDGTLSHLLTEGLGLDIAQALGVALRGDRALPLRCATLDLALSNGRATIRRGVVDNSDTTITIGGSVNLRDERLELALRAQPKDVSPLALRAPITVTGSFEHPRLGIEGGALAARLAGSAILAAAVSPLAALLPLIDPGERPEGDPCRPGGAP